MNSEFAQQMGAMSLDGFDTYSQAGRDLWSKTTAAIWRRGKCESLGDNIRTYEGQSTLDPNSGTWSEPITFPNSRSFLFTGLARGKDTWFRVRARNTVGAGPWSDPATIMVT